MDDLAGSLLEGSAGSGSPEEELGLRLGGRRRRRSRYPETTTTTTGTLSSSSSSSSSTRADGHDRHDRHDRHDHTRRQSIPPGDPSRSPSTSSSTSSSTTSPSSSSSPRETRTRLRLRRTDQPTDPRTKISRTRPKIEQVFFPPFEESSGFGIGPGGRVDERVKDDDDRVDDDRTDENREKNDRREGWARLLALAPPSGAGSEAVLNVNVNLNPASRPKPPRSMLNHRRTQSSTDILAPLTRVPPALRTPLALRPTGYSLNQMDGPVMVRARTTLPIVHTHVNSEPDPNAHAHANAHTNVSISPLTRSARRMLNEDRQMSGDSPIEACAGGDGLVEVIKLDRLGGGRRDDGSMEVMQEDQRVSARERLGLV
jgi:hypothetical protein